jgi:predicted nucleic acid-binding protein
VTRPFTIDASVIVRAASPTEERSEESERFIRSIGSGNRPVVQPTLARPEVAGAVSRASGDKSLAAATAASLDTLPGVIFVPLDTSLAAEAADIAIKAGLRGADAVYAATARRFDAILVTVDAEQRRRLPADITVCSPAEALRL